MFHCHIFKLFLEYLFLEEYGVALVEEGILILNCGEIYVCEACRTSAGGTLLLDGLSIVLLF